jgi:hypothetical protein
MKQLTVLVLLALFGLGLAGASRGQDKDTKETPPPTTGVTHPTAAPVVTAALPVEVMNPVPWLWFFVVLSLLAVNAILLVLGLGQLFSIKAAIEKIANK